MRTLAFVCCAIAALLCAPVGAQAQGFVVIVNANNPVSTLSKDEVSRLFLKKQAKWNGGVEAMPVDLDQDAVKDALCKGIHGRPAAAIKAFWQQQLFAGKDVPPPAMMYERDVIGFVKSNEAAIGYVPAGTDLPAGVKAITVR